MCLQGSRFERVCWPMSIPFRSGHRHGWRATWRWAVLLLLIGVVCGGLASYGAGPLPLLGIVGAALVLPVLLRMPLVWLMYLFIFAICFTAWVPVSVNVGGLNLRVSQMLLPIVLLRLLPGQPVFVVSRGKLRLFVSGALLWASLLFWTAVNAASYDSMARPFGHVLLLGLNLLHMAAVYLLVARTGRLREALLSLLVSVSVLNAVLLVTTVGAELGIGFFQRFLSEEGAELLVGGELAAGVVSRFKFAGVISGVMSAVALIVTVTLLLRRDRRRSKWPWLLGAVSVAGMVVGFSRQNVVSLAGGLAMVGWYLFVRGQLGRLVRITMVSLIVAVIGVAVLHQLPGTRAFVQAFAGRALQLFQPEAYTTGTVGGRMQLWSGMWRDIAGNPLWGNGQDAYLKHHPNPWERGSHNFPLEVLHASGIVGFLAYAHLHLAVFGAARKAVRLRHLPETERWLLLGLIGAAVAVWLSSITNLIFSNPVYWMVLGLLVAGGRRVRTTALRHRPE